MKDHKIQVKEFTVSAAYEVFRGGDKTSTFVSMNLSLEEPCSIEEFPIVQMNAAEQVAKACIYDALARGAFNVEEANGRILNLDNATKKIREKLIMKLESINTESND